MVPVVVPDSPPYVVLGVVDPNVTGIPGLVALAVISKAIKSIITSFYSIRSIRRSLIFSHLNFTTSNLTLRIIFTYAFYLPCSLPNMSSDKFLN